MGQSTPSGQRAWSSRLVRHRDERGINTLTIVLVLPGLVVLLAMVIQVVLYWHASHLVTAAAQEGMRAAQMADGSAQAGRYSAESFLRQAGPRLVLEPEVAAERDEDSARVEVRARVAQVLPGAFPVVAARAVGPVEDRRVDR